VSPRSPEHVQTTVSMKRGDFRLAADKGTRWAGRLMVLYVLPRGTGLRSGFTAGRRIGGAVQRNRARRLMREAWRSLAGRAGPGFDLVFVARTPIVQEGMQEVAAEMAELLGRAGVIE
jgi:ribonuclease P protein component